MLNLRRSAILRGLRILAVPLEKLLREQVENVIDAALNTYARLYGVPRTRGVKETITVTALDYEDLWASAIEREMALVEQQITVQLTPAIQSVVDDVSDKVSVLLGKEPPAPQVINRRVRNLASQVTQINETTRNRLNRIIQRGIREQRTMFEVAQMVRDQIPSLSSNRVATIVRTEMGNAADEAVRASVIDGEVVTHVDVMGCEAVEPNIPTFDGEPTCNIRGVSATRVDELQFHINHTGAIVASAFRKADGGVPDIPLRGATIDE